MDRSVCQQKATPPSSLVRWKACTLKTPRSNEGKFRPKKNLLGKSPREWSVLSTSKKKCVQVSRLPFSPTIERIRAGINLRTEASIACSDKSFEGNQSFPRISKQRLRRHEIDLVTPMKHKLDTMEKIRVDGSNGLRFNFRRVKGCFTPATGSPYNASAVTSASDCLMRVPKSGINPNKAVFTMDSRTSQILIVNNNACQLLGYSSRELCNMQFSDLLAKKNKSHVCALAEGQLNSEDGTMVLLSGKVVEMNTKSNTKVAVSLWVRQIDQDGRCLAVAEPVERRVCQFVIDKNGIIVSATSEALMLFQFEILDQFIGMDISVLIPAIIIPDADNSVIAKHIRKQKATGKTSDGISFPLCLLISHNETDTNTTDSGLSNQSSHLYLVTVWVFQNISGLIVIDEHGIIESCNHHFSMLMFGYAQNKILNQHITKLIPNFGQELEFLGLARSRNATESSLDNESVTETDPVFDKNYQIPEPEPKKVIQRPVSESIRHSIDFTKLDGDIIGSENSIEKLLTAENMAEKASFIRGIANTLSTSEQQTNLLKSVSADVLVRENLENNRNAANVTNKSSSSAERRSSMMICEAMENTVESGCLNENDLLTPVNDATNSYYMSQNLQSIEQEYHSSDIVAGLHSVESLGNELKDDMHTKTPNNNEKMPKLETEPGPALLTSTPDLRNPLTESNAPKIVNYTDGRYKGEAIHSDGNVIDILYAISCQTLPCGRKAYCVWICRDPDTVYDMDDDIRHQNLTLTFNSITSTIENSLGQAIKNTAAQNCSRPNSASLMSQFEDEEQISGEFCKHYTPLRQIGKGAYGYVKLAYRNSDHLLVVAKFILKEKLCPQQMILTEDKKEIPMEIYLLTTLKHPNIVTVYDVFENEKFFQLVMEKHGCGMDLFEFIDRRPMIDEKLGCFIFRQIANAVNYLHSLNVLHRDIKDENIIIDQNFHVKLIDFGSATFMEDGKLFSTFFGTTEYCSPEVLAGNKYAGPELEMWSLGVTLYVLMFFENPFLDVEETLRSELVMPHKVSANLENLLYSMLDKNPRTRCTMRQLMAHSWINQEINPALFDFAWTIPCDPHEANPDKYFSEQQMYSSATALSTTSPQDSLSLVDEDSMIDGDDDIHDDYREERLNEQLQDSSNLINDKCNKSASVQLPNPESNISSQMSAMAIDNTTDPQPSQANKSLLVHRRSSQRQHQPIQLHFQPAPLQTAETTATTTPGKTVNVMSYTATTSTTQNEQQPDAIYIVSTANNANNCTTNSSTKTYKNTKNILSIDISNSAHSSSTSGNDTSDESVKVARDVCIVKPKPIYPAIVRECPVIDKKIGTVNPDMCSMCTMYISSPGSSTSVKMSSSQSETQLSQPKNHLCTSAMPSPSKSVTNCTSGEYIGSSMNFSCCSVSQSPLHQKKKFDSNMICCPKNNLLKADNNQLILSKSENNICEKRIREKLAIYDVVSLNDLNTEDPFPNCKLTEISKVTKALTDIHIDDSTDLRLIRNESDEI